MPAAAELAAGLLAPVPRLAPKYLYDALGSRLFELITLLPEYYLTRTECALLERCAPMIAQAAGEGVALVDLGAGNCAKARLLMPALQPSEYVAIDISHDFVDRAVNGLAADYPAMLARVVLADLTDDLSGIDLPPARRLFFFPGSSIGNFDPQQAQKLLDQVRGLCDADGALLVGIDLVKERAVLDAAYNDALGVTAAFNRNALNHVNATLCSDFDLAEWRHRAFYNCARSRIEMHLVAETAVGVSWPGGGRRFLAGESIHTENSYKYRLDDFRAMLAHAGFSDVSDWTDERGWFAVCLARP